MPKDAAETLHVDDVPEMKTAPKDEKPEEKAAETRMYAESFKDPDELEKGYLELKKTLGKQGNELGNLRSRNKELEDMFASKETKDKVETPAEKSDFQKMQIELAQRYESGEINFAEFIRQNTALTAQTVQQEMQKHNEMVLNEAKEQFTSVLQEREHKAMADKFHSENPDFKKMQESGEFDELKAKYPFFDDVTAYYAKKAAQAKEEGRREQAEIEAGSKEAGKVVTDTGTVMQQTKKPSTEAEIKASMLSVLEK